MASNVTIKKYVFAEEGAKEGTLAGLLELAYRVHAKTVELCPVDEGQLRNSYMVRSANGDELFNSAGGEMAPEDHKITTEPKGLMVIVGTNSDHWYPEYGTRYQVAQPHLRPAIALSKGQSAASVMKKYCREKMEHEYKQRKYTLLFGGQ